MFDKKRHHFVLVKILKEIYSAPSLRSILGFKGGTAAALFYQLPRVSVDLDFDLLTKNKQTTVFSGLKKILSQFGRLQDTRQKRNTLFFLLSYQKGEKKIKIEVSLRPSLSGFTVKNYLGIPVLVMKKKDMAANKLAAFLTRKKFAARDLFDLWFFLKENWIINEKLVKEKTGFSMKTALQKTILKVKKVKKNQLLQGLGEFLEEKQKQLVREKIIKDTLFYLRFYLKNRLK